jgi:hypothetical protein
MVKASWHPRFDLDGWCRRFPLAHFQRTSGPRRYESTPADDPLDRWKPEGRILASPADICCIEQVRRDVATRHELGQGVPVDWFVWAQAPALAPFLTRLGGVPHREATRPWPRTEDGQPFTFVGQFCFLDSHDILASDLPGTVLLVFVRDEHGFFYGENGIVLEWSELKLASPMTAAQVPPPSLRVPSLSGVIHRTVDYPDLWLSDADPFALEGHQQSELFSCTQGIKIGTSAPSQEELFPDGELWCVLSSIKLADWWPLVDREAAFPSDQQCPVFFGDAGSVYIGCDDDGRVCVDSDCG